MGRALGNNISEGAKKARLSRGRSGFNAVAEALANLARAELRDPAVVPVGARRHTLHPLVLTSHCDSEYAYKGGVALGRVALFKNNHWEGKVRCYVSAACPSSWESKCFRPEVRGGGYRADTRGTTQHPL